MKKIKMILTIIISHALIFGMINIPSSASSTQGVSGICKANAMTYMGMAESMYSVHIIFDARLDAVPVEASGNLSVTNNLKINGRTFTDILMAYPGSIQIYLGCNDDKRMMELYINSNLPDTYGLEYIKNGKNDNIEILKGMLLPSGVKMVENQNFIRYGLVDFYEPSVNSAEITQNPTDFAANIFFNVDINYGAKEASGNANYTNFIKVNGKTLTEIIAENPLVSNPVKIYVSCWPTETFNNRLLSVNISKSVKSGTGFTAINDVIEIMPGLTLFSGVVDKYQKLVLGSDGHFYESISTYKISAVKLTPDWNYIRLKFNRPISNDNVGTTLLNSQFNNKIKFNGYTLTEMSTNAVDTNGNALSNPMSGYIWTDGTGDGFSDSSEVIITININRNLGGGKGLKLDGTDTIEILPDIYSYNNYYKTTETEKFVYNSSKGIWTRFSNISFGSYNISASKKITNVSSDRRTIDTFKAGLTFDEGATVAVSTVNGDQAVGTGTSVSVTANGYTNNYTVIVYGDVDNDGKIGVSDLVRVKSHLLKNTSLAGYNFAAGNLSNQSDISISDLLAIKKDILGLAPINQILREDINNIDFQQSIFNAPNQIEPVSNMDYQGIHAIYFDSINYKNQSTKVFAYIGYPEGASTTNKVPAVVLAHGGGGTAYAQWVKEWTSRGYAAIAIDLEGHMPVSPGSLSYTTHANAGPANSGNFSDVNEPLQDQWMYQACSAVIKANSLLRADEKIISSQIGVCGISWGGIVTSIIISQDRRFAFGVPIYGCGFMNNSEGFFSDLLKNNPTAVNLWEPSKWFSQVKTPILWINDASDKFFSLNSTAKSFNAVAGSNMTVLPYLVHGHFEGWAVQESYAFADSICRSSANLIKFTKQPTIDNGSVTFQVPGGITVNKAQLVYTTTAYTYDTNNICQAVWIVSPLTVSGNTLSVTLPVGTKSYYINIIDNRGLTTSSQMVTLS